MDVYDISSLFSKGIVLWENCSLLDGGPHFVAVKGPHKVKHVLYSDVSFTTRKAAVRAAEEKRKARIDSLKAQLLRLESMRFE